MIQEHHLYFPNSVSVKPFWSVDNGVHWYEFTNGPFDPITAHVIDRWQYGTGNYNPSIDPNPPEGEDIFIDITPDIPLYNHNLIIKLELFGVDPDDTHGGVTINYMYLKYQLSPTSGRTVRQLLANDTYTSSISQVFIINGIIDRYINHILGDLSFSSAYPVDLNTDYVYGYLEASDINAKIPFIKFPYMDGLTAIQDIIKYGSALKFLQSLSGYHWMVDPDANLLIAPVNNHTVAGIDVSHLVSSKWVLKPYPSGSIKVKEDMVTQAFKQELPIANYVLVAGKYQFPLDDSVCESTVGWIVQTSRSVHAVYDDKVVGAVSINLKGFYTPPLPIENNFAYPLPVDLDFTKLMGENTTPSIFFWMKVGGYTEKYEFRLYWDDDDGGLVDRDNYISCPFTGMETNVWVSKDFSIPNTIYMNNFKGWSLHSLHGTKNWSDIPTLKYLGITFTSSFIAVAPTDVWIDGLVIGGVCIFGAYDSTNITANGCRIITIKNSFANTQHLTLLNNTDPLALEVVYELQRHRKLRMTGEIKIPLDPIYKSGQQVYVYAEYDPLTTTYKISKWFRINKAIHDFDAIGAYTTLSLTDDLECSIPVDTNDAYTVTMRAFNPDFQSRTHGSLKSAGDFDLGLVPITKDYPS